MKSLLALALMMSPAFAGDLPTVEGVHGNKPEISEPYVSAWCPSNTVEIWTGGNETIQFLDPTNVIWTRGGRQHQLVTGGAGTGISSRVAVSLRGPLGVENIYDWTETEGIPVLLWNGEPFTLHCKVLDES